MYTGKSLSEALIFASTNPQYDDRLFIELKVQYMKIPSSNLGRTCSVQKLFLTFRTIFVRIMFSPRSAKRRASDKELPVLHYITVLLLLPHSHRRAVSPRPPIYHYNNNKSSLWITGPFLTARFLLMSTKVSDLFSFWLKRQEGGSPMQGWLAGYILLGMYYA